MADPQAPSAIPAIAFTDIWKRFTRSDGRPLDVLQAIGFEVPAGEIVAIVGPSGSGKSTLLNIAAGLLAPDRGRAAVMGEPTDGAVAWHRVGYMFQDDRLLPWRTACKNVALALEARPVAAAERRRRAVEALRLVELAEFLDAFPHQLSGGMRSRVALARSLVGEPDILLMDEPFSRLDAQTRSVMHRELLRIQGLRRMSILFVTHDVEEAVILADRIVVLRPRPGRLRAQLQVDLPHPRIGTDAATALVAQLRGLLAEGDSADGLKEAS
ncbi:MAG TPA: ABC transporter ATP-binding protein [Alphaproteobacteria bacterium]